VSLRPAIITSISKFLNAPFVPTLAQQNLLYALKKKDQHILFRANTGTGKSFILAMHALNLPRAMSSETKPTTTVLILVPNPDLAVQYHYWITQILGPSFKDSTKSLQIVQTLFRTKEGEEKQEQNLREFPNPHIIISTPTRMLDLIAKDTNLIDVENASTIIVDEADELFQPPDKITNKIRHPTPAEILLDWIYEKRTANKVKTSMQFIATSATLTT
jgi:superfamily II DNA/RNA helicase